MKIVGIAEIRIINAIFNYSNSNRISGVEVDYVGRSSFIGIKYRINLTYINFSYIKSKDLPVFNSLRF